ncbi:MAG: hypothetical protein WBN88_04325 [Anderseniella sp.]|jgi:hypothetical protein
MELKACFEIDECVEGAFIPAPVMMSINPLNDQALTGSFKIHKRPPGGGKAFEGRI